MPWALLQRTSLTTNRRPVTRFSGMEASNGTVNRRALSGRVTADHASLIRPPVTHIPYETNDNKRCYSYVFFAQCHSWCPVSLLISGPAGNKCRRVLCKRRRYVECSCDGAELTKSTVLVRGCYDDVVMI